MEGAHSWDKARRVVGWNFAVRLDSSAPEDHAVQTVGHRFMREHIRRFAVAYDLDTRSDVATAESVEKSPNGGG